MAEKVGGANFFQYFLKVRGLLLKYPTPTHDPLPGCQEGCKRTLDWPRGGGTIYIYIYTYIHIYIYIHTYTHIWMAKCSAPPPPPLRPGMVHGAGSPPPPSHVGWGVGSLFPLRGVLGLRV